MKEAGSAERANDPVTVSLIRETGCCDVRPYNPLLTSLPRLHVSGIAGGWMSDFPQQVVAESRLGRVGNETMLTRMAELMFIEVVRRHVEQLSPQHSGWLGGVRGDVVGSALSALHQRPAHPWTPVEQPGEGRDDRGACGLRVGAGVQPCIQARNGGFAAGMAPSTLRRVIGFSLGTT